MQTICRTRTFWAICKYNTSILDELLVKGNTLSPLTNNPDEWMDVTEMSG